MRGALGKTAGFRPADIVDWLRPPHRLKAAVIGTLAAVGLFAVYLPLNGRVEELELAVRDARDRRETLADVADLMKTANSLGARLPRSTDENWWATYFLKGTTENGVRLESLSPASLSGLDFSTLKGLEFTLTVSGNFRNIGRFVAWMESNDPVVRVCRVVLAGAAEGVSARLSVAALVSQEDGRGH